MAFKLFGRHKRIKALMLGFANLITAITIEDLAWFVNRSLVPLADDPKGGRTMQFSDWTSMRWSDRCRQFRDTKLVYHFACFSHTVVLRSI